MPNEIPKEHLMQHLIDSQDRLYAYILGLVASATIAEDILQETNLVICRKSDEANTIQNFTAWMYRIAHFQVLAYRKKDNTDRHLFNDDLIEQLSVDGIQYTSDLEGSRVALEHCMAKLPEDQRDLILQRYFPKNTVSKIAKKTQENDRLHFSIALSDSSHIVEML